jgi:hypothetical protein
MFEGIAGFLHVAFRAHHVTEVVVGGSKVGTDDDRTPERVGGLFQSPHVVQRAAHSVVGPGIVRVRRQRFQTGIDGVLSPAVPQHDLCQVVLGCGKIRPQA